MILRSLAQSDILKIDKFWREHIAQEYSLPGLDNRIIDAVTENETGEIIGYGQVRHFAEAMLFLDPTKSKRERAQSVKLLMAEAFRGTEAFGLNELYCYIRDPKFAQLIANRYGFLSIERPGTLLLRRF